MGFFDQGKTCYLSTHSDASAKLIYRDYILTSNGSMLVFNSFGDGDEGSTTGAREYFFFPRKPSRFDYSLNPAEPILSIQFTNGDQILFSGEKAQPVKMNMASIEIDPEIRPDNQGGVEIKNYNGLLLDLGYAMGTAPSYRPKQKAEFRDPTGRRCQVVMKEIFEITRADSEFRFPTDLELKEYLSSRCPNLDLSSL